MDEEKKKKSSTFDLDGKEIIESCLMKEEFEALGYKRNLHFFCVRFER
jgi:hypothetical protein